MHYIRAAGTVAIYTKIDDSNPATNKTRYLHRDHLGSIVSITDEAGVVTEQLSFDAYGQRRATDWQPALFPPSPIETPRGFTGQEHLDGVALIHMNGRVYDPLLGRFLSADPFVQFPKSTQGLNRYTYVNNNPLSFTDPSGFFLGGFFRAIGKAIGAIGNAVKAAVKGVAKVAQKALQNRFVQIAATAAASYFGGPLGAALASGLISGANGGNLGDALMAAGTTLAFAAVTAGIEVSFGLDTGFLSGAHVGKILAHGAASGTFSKLRGGKFEAGFLAGSVSAFAAPGIGQIGGRDLNSAIGRITASAVVGGASAELGGGKFKNGAVSGAFQRLSSEFAAGNLSRSGQNSATAGPGQSTVEIRYKRVDVVRFAKHAFVVVTGPDGQQFGFRAGPLSLTDGIGSPQSSGGSGLFRTILAEVGTFNRNFTDFTADVVATQTVLFTDRSFASLTTTLTEFANELNDNPIAYNFLSRNSNSAAFQAVVRLGVSRPSAIVFAPGNGTLLAIP